MTDDWIVLVIDNWSADLLGRECLVADVDASWVQFSILSAFVPSFKFKSSVNVEIKQ